MTGENDEHKVEFGTHSLTHSATSPRLCHLPTLAHLPAHPPTRLPAHAHSLAHWPPANAHPSSHTHPPAYSQSWSQSVHLFTHSPTCPRPALAHLPVRPPTRSP